MLEKDGVISIPLGVASVHLLTLGSVVYVPLFRVDTTQDIVISGND